MKYGYGITSLEEKQRQRELSAKGSTLAEIGQCGTDCLPCGVCKECEENDTQLDAELDAQDAWDMSE